MKPSATRSACIRFRDRRCLRDFLASDKEFETAVQTYTGALQGYAEAARAKPKKTRFGGRARSSDAKARG